MAKEAEPGVILPTTKEHQALPGAPEAGKGKNSLLEPSEGAWPRGHLDFGLLASRVVTE